MAEPSPDQVAYCSAMQNLREAIAGYRIRLAQETNEHKRDALLAVALEYLERYLCHSQCCNPAMDAELISEVSAMRHHAYLAHSAT